MTHDGISTAEIQQHAGGYLTRKSPRRLSGQILSTPSNARTLQGRFNLRKIGERRAYHDRRGGLPKTSLNASEQRGHRGTGSVHFPVASHQRFTHRMPPIQNKRSIVERDIRLGNEFARQPIFCMPIRRDFLEVTPWIPIDPRSKSQPSRRAPIPSGGPFSRQPPNRP
ncbi:hypothetical protein CCP4SC76_1910005 [Gammaproteobacteria bacterium]